MQSLPVATEQGAAGPDNLLGVCAAIGELTSISPLFVRIGFVLAMLGLSFEMTIAAYIVLGGAVALARWERRGAGAAGKTR